MAETSWPDMTFRTGPRVPVPGGLPPEDIIMKLNSETLNNLIKNSTSKEDRFFYNELYNLSLQIKQQKLINEEKY